MIGGVQLRRKQRGYLKMKPVQPILNEQWIVEGKVFPSRPSEEDSLYICPLLNRFGAVPNGINVLHSLVLDNNVLTDLVENRRPANREFLHRLLRANRIELNPVFAMIEQRQKFGGATEALTAYAEYLEAEFGWSEAKVGAEDFESSLASAKGALTANIDLLSGYLGATIFLYHQSAPAPQKLEWLAGLIKGADIPYFQLHFYFAALLFLTKDKPDLFGKKDLDKIREETKLESSFEKQKKKILNLSNDLALPAVSIFPSSAEPQIVFPYIATRDRLVQLFLSEVSCRFVEALPDGRANGSWEIRKGGLLDTYLGSAVEDHIPRRMKASNEEEKLVRKSRLQAFSDQYIRKCTELRGCLV
jgi:hypothetical protein